MESVVIGNPGYFVLPDCKIPVLGLKVHRNQDGQIRELIAHFDATRRVREKLKSHKLVPLQLRGTEEQIEIDVHFEYESNPIISVQHLHKTEFDQNQIEKIERFLEMIDSHPKKTPQ